MAFRNGRSVKTAGENIAHRPSLRSLVEIAKVVDNLLIEVQQRVRIGGDIIGSPLSPRLRRRAVIEISDEGTPLPPRRLIDFKGAGVTATDNGVNTEVTVAGGVVQDEGVVLPSEPAINFRGAGVKASDDPLNFRTNVDISPAVLHFGDDGPTVGGVTRFMYAGTQTASAAEIKYRYPFGRTFHGLTIRATAGPGGVLTDTVTIRKNGVDTALVISLTGAETSATLVGTEVAFLSTDDLSVRLVTAPGSALANPMVVLEAR
jgi:hypothetical protein